MLGRALTPEQVMETAFDACAAIAVFDVAAIALYDKDRAKHKIAAVRIAPGGEGLVDPAQLKDLEFKDNAGLVSMVVKNRHYLPAGGEPREVSAPIYTRKVKVDDAKSLLVLPLLSADEAIGTLTLVARAEKRFSSDVREMLAVIANQVAISLQNGFLYKKMETMATTDGLTGLTNHRTFQARFEDLLQRATGPGTALDEGRRHVVRVQPEVLQRPRGGDAAVLRGLDLDGQLLESVSDLVGVERTALESLVQEAEGLRTVQTEVTEVGRVLVEGVEQVLVRVHALPGAGGEDVVRLLRGLHEVVAASRSARTCFRIGSITRSRSPFEIASSL